MAVTIPLGKTTMHEATNAPRYMRQELIKSIQEKTKNTILCYVSGCDASISRDDPLAFADLLQFVSPGTNVDLLLHTTGGDIDAAEKLISMLDARVTTGQLRVIVPDYAKSSGTLMALGANQIVMSDSSELGPIDPQIMILEERGSWRNQSVQNYLDAYRTHSDRLRQDPNDPVAALMLSKMDPSTICHVEATLTRSKQLAEKLLKRRMDVNWSDIAGQLLDTHKWISHGQMINWEDAKLMGLSVEYLLPTSEEWLQYWKLFCLQRLQVSDSSKIFESEHVLIAM
jgi:hypothetical protein